MNLHLTIVADVFRHEAQAKHALEALRQAGFDYDQIGIAMHGHEGIDLQGDLENLGVPHEQASYYAQEVKAGHTVISVRPDGREREAHEIMRQSGALVDAGNDGTQSFDIDKQKAAWEQAIASHQAYLAAQRAAKLQEDFHQPRSLKPRKEVVTIQPVQAELRPDAILQQAASDTAFVQQDEVTEQKPIVAPLSQASMSTSSSEVSDMQSNDVHDQLPLTEERPETISIDDEETEKRLNKQEQNSTETLSPQTQLEKPKNSNMMRTGVLLGGLLLGLGTSVLIALFRGERIRQFALSTVHATKKQFATIKRDRDHE